MRRVLKIIALMLALFLFLLFCLFFFNFFWYHGRIPTDQPGTVWVSLDGSLVIEVEDAEFPDVKATLFRENGEALYFDCYMFPQTMISLLPDGSRGGRVEYWAGGYWTKNFFTARVCNSTYFAEGDTLFFRKLAG